MNKDCEVVRDLLPLYVDEVCSPASRELVDGHLQSCEDCTDILKRLRDSAPEETLNEEMTGVLTRQAKRFRRKSAVVGMVFAGILLLPILICLIVVLASGGMDWFFIVVCSLLLAATLTVVPLVMPRRKFLWTIGSFTVMLLLLLGVICLLSSDGSWFFIAGSACVFGLSVVFLPIVVYREPIKSALGNHKGITVMVIDTALLYLLLFAISRNGVSADYWNAVLSVSLPCLTLPWGLFLLIRYPQVNGLTKAGFCLMWTGIFAFFADWLCALLSGWLKALPRMHLLVWNTETTYENIMWLILMGSLLIGAVFVVLGICAKRKGERK